MHRANDSTTPTFRQIPGGVEWGLGGNVVQRVFSQGSRNVRAATTPIIRHIPGGVDKEAHGMQCGKEVDESGGTDR